MNKVLFIGRLTANPELKTKDSIKKITVFRLAVNNKNDQFPLFVNIYTFDKLAEQCFEALQKGSQVFVEGRLDLYQNKENKTDYYSVVANQVTFLKGTKTTGIKQVTMITTNAVKKEKVEEQSQEEN